MLRTGILLLGCLAIPEYRLLIVLGHALALGITHTQVVLRAGMPVVADAKLTHCADFDWPTASVSVTAVGNGLRSLQAGQGVPAAWVNFASATTQTSPRRGVFL